MCVVTLPLVDRVSPSPKLHEYSVTERPVVPATVKVVGLLTAPVVGLAVRVISMAARSEIATTANPEP